MPRKRLRPEYGQRNYTFDCRIVGDVPQVLWDTARAMQAVWNGIVSRHRATLDAFTDDTPKAAKADAYEAFWRDAYEYVKNEGDALNLPCWCKWHVFDSFKASQQRWARKQGGCPREHHGLRKIIIPHRTDSGGVEVDWLWRDSDRKHTAVRPVRGKLARGYFSINGQRIPLEIYLHRAVPADAILKRVALCGTHERPFGWEWRLMLTVEEPPRPALPQTGRAAAIDLGWRVTEGGLRIGVVYDGHAAREIVLPFDLANNHERRLRDRLAARGLSAETALDYHARRELQAAQDAKLEECKARLSACDRSAWPEEARQMMSGLTKMRAGGLNRLKRLLGEAGCLPEFVSEWAARHLQLSRRIRSSQIHAGKRKDYLYRLIARWLADNYDALAWEGDLGLKEMAETETDEYAMENAKQYRQYAGLFRLRQFIKEAMSAPGRELIDGGTAYSTRTHYLCGGELEKSGKLRLNCLQCGGSVDQDVNASRNLWASLPDELRAVTGPRASVDRSQLKGVIGALSA